MTDQGHGLSFPKLTLGSLGFLKDWLSRGRSKISSYFFRPGGVYSIAICRVALFSYLWLHVLAGAQAYIPNGGEAYLAGLNNDAYYPKSLVWFLFPSAPPPGWFIDAVLLTAKVSTVLAIFGVLTRVSMIVSGLSCVFLGSLIFSWELLWSHPYNSGLIGVLPFMFGRAGDVLSVDSIAMRLLKRPIRIDRDVYWWPVILGLFGVTMVYFGGFYAKWSTPDFTYDFAWVFSDNLRNSVALPWLIRGQTLPWNADLIVNNPLIWKLAAAGHMATQGLPILAMFAMTKPVIRMVEGAIFVAGVYLLGFMMGLWNTPWALFGVFFVDWDWLLKKMRLLVGQPSVRKPSGPIKRSVIITFAFAFIALNLVIIFFRIDDKGWNRLYPFSSMTFYSNVAATRPYDKHRHYPFTYGETIISTPTASAKWSCAPNVATGYVVTFNVAGNAPDKAAQQIGAIKAMVEQVKRAGGGNISDCEGVFATSPLKSVDLYGSILNIPPYPEKVRFDVSHRALVGRYEAETDRYIAGAVGNYAEVDKTVEVKTVTIGLDVAKREIFLANDPWQNRDIGPLIQMPGTWTGDTFRFEASAYEALPNGWYQ